MTAATREARALYREAIARDPNFALAWARLSYLDAVIAGRKWQAPELTYPEIA